MYLAYFDESGDDGYPATSSNLFVLSTLYFHYLDWKSNFDRMRMFRQDLKTSFNLPIKMEMHTRNFILNKKPYKELRISDDDRLKIIGMACDFLATLDLKIINVVIVKRRIKNPTYQVLDHALTYCIQRIENDLKPDVNPTNKFMIITDPGRVGKMCYTSRRIQRINYIPSQFYSQPYRKEIKSLIEDPLPKDSKESYFIQFADMVSWIVFQYSKLTLNIGETPGRMPAGYSEQLADSWMHKLIPVLNLKASKNHHYGVVYYPKE